MATIERRKLRDRTVYRVKIRLRGLPSTEATFPRLTDARLWAQRTETEMRQGRYLPADAKGHTVADMVDRYLASVLPRKLQSSRHSQRPHLEWWKHRLGAYFLDRVTSAMISECRDELLQGKSAATAVRYLAALSHCFSVARREWEWVRENPVQNVTRPRESRGRTRFLSDAERVRLVEACTNQSRDLLDFVLVALYTGMRQGEILGLCWPDVDLRRRLLSIRDTKNRQSRSVPIVGPVLAALSRRCKIHRLDTDKVFPDSLRGEWERARRTAGLIDFRFHDLRHTTASYLAMSGATLAEIAEVLGHKTLAMVRRYAHLTDAHVTAVMDRMAERLGAG